MYWVQKLSMVHWSSVTNRVLRISCCHFLDTKLLHKCHGRGDAIKTNPSWLIYLALCLQPIEMRSERLSPASERDSCAPLQKRCISGQNFWKTEEVLLDYRMEAHFWKAIYRLEPQITVKTKTRTKDKKTKQPLDMDFSFYDLNLFERNGATFHIFSYDLRH